MPTAFVRIISVAIVVVACRQPSATSAYSSRGNEVEPVFRQLEVLDSANYAGIFSFNPSPHGCSTEYEFACPNNGYKADEIAAKEDFIGTLAASKLLLHENWDRAFPEIVKFNGGEEIHFFGYLFVEESSPVLATDPAQPNFCDGIDSAAYSTQFDNLWLVSADSEQLIDINCVYGYGRNHATADSLEGGITHRQEVDQDPRCKRSRRDAEEVTAASIARRGERPTAENRTPPLSSFSADEIVVVRGSMGCRWPRNPPPAPVDPGDAGSL